MFIAELDHPRFAEFDLPRLRTGIMAGSPLPDRGDESGGRDMHRRRSPSPYGMTETSPVSCQSSTDDAARASASSRPSARSSRT